MGLFGRPKEVKNPPPSLDHTLDVNGPGVPPTYVYTQRREPHAGPSMLMAPWDNYEKMYDLNIPWQEAPDPIRQSDFWAAGHKIHPAAQMQIVTNLAIGSREAVMEDTFHIGKLLGYIHRPMYAGQQKPSVIRTNIQEAVPGTYGSMYEVQGVMPSGPVVTATGFTLPTSEHNDGYPY